MNRAEYDREVYDHERQQGEYAEDEDPFAPNEHAVLATYVLQLIGPRLDIPVVPEGFGRALVGGLVAEAEENLSDVLPDGYYVKIREWDV